MGIWSRIKAMFQIKASNQLDKMEKVDETLDYSYQKQLSELSKVKTSIADLVTAKKRIQNQQTRLNEEIEKLEGQAKKAIQMGNEDLARQALERKNVIQSELVSIDKQVEELELQQKALTDAEQKLRTRIDNFRMRKETIKAQYSAAEAQVRISEAASGVGESMADVGMAMQRALDKAENMKARADALGELEAAGAFEDPMLLGTGDDIERQLSELSSGSVVEGELERMKAELGMPSSVKELSDGESPSLSKEETVEGKVVE